MNRVKWVKNVLCTCTLAHLVHFPFISCTLFTSATGHVLTADDSHKQAKLPSECDIHKYTTTQPQNKDINLVNKTRI